MATTVILHFFGIFIAIFGSLMMNIMGLYNTDSKQDSTYLLNVGQIIVGSFCIVASLIYLIYFRFRIMHAKKRLEYKQGQARARSAVSISPAINENNQPVQADHDLVNVFYVARNMSANEELPPSYNSLNRN